jgi:hypothetical protein
MSPEKKNALLILGLTGAIAIVVSLFLGIIIITFFPLLVTLSLLLLGVLCKWGIEWCIRNRHIFKIAERANKIKKKLKVEEGINVVKESYRTLKEKK